MPRPMEAVVLMLRTTWLVGRPHIDLCRTCTATCR